MSRPFDPEELRALLDALCEETISPEQVRRLEELVLGHPEAEAFVKGIRFHDPRTTYAIMPTSKRA